MADYLDIAQETLRSVPDFVVLADIADRSGVPLAIRGGVARNLLARSLQNSNSEGPVRSLSDLVDPFSDIDLVVKDHTAAASILLQVHSRIALAGFFRWEFKIRDQVEQWARTNAQTSLDGIEVVFLPNKPPVLANYKVGAEDLKNGQLRMRMPPRSHRAWDLRDRVESDIFALRAARFAAQFGLQLEGARLDKIWELPKLEGQMSIPAYAAAMLDLAALDVLFTARTRRDASLWLETIDEFVSLMQAKSSIAQTRRLASSDKSWIQAVAYPSWGEMPPDIQLGGDAPQESIGDEESLLPWMPVTLPAASENCCRGDFSLGSLAIAWRSEDVTLLRENAEVAPIVLVPPADRYDESSRLTFGAPGIVDIGRSAVIRLDWGYAQMIAGGGRTVFVGARTAHQPE